MIIIKCKLVAFFARTTGNREMKKTLPTTSPKSPPLTFCIVVPIMNVSYEETRSPIFE